jgi:hypothetical protein
MRFLTSALVVALAGCGTQASTWKLPVEIEGRWKLTATPPGTDGFGLVGPLVRKKSVIGTYEDGNDKLYVFAFEQANTATAFEQVQKWRAQPGRIAFHHGAWLIVVESARLSAGELSRIGSIVEKNIPN